MVPTEVLEAYHIPVEQCRIEPFGNGHINDTFRITPEGDSHQYILQRINHYVFVHPEQVMENIDRVTCFLRKKIREEGGDPERETVTVIGTGDGHLSCGDAAGNTWRCLLFVPDTISYDQPETLEHLEECGRVFGLFSRRLHDFPAETLHETILQFHDTPNRVKQLQEAVDRNASGKLDEVRGELAFAMDRAEKTTLLLQMNKQGKIPIRVTHNDTKVNNVLFDRRSGKAVCVVDLDTVMPGLMAYDFGDAIRVGASTAPEDERELSRMHLDLEKYEAFARGFLGELRDVLSQEEVLSLAIGAWLMTLENGLRFLADHLNGDVYFKIHRDNQNLDRARAQFALVADMEQHQAEMESILLKYAK